MSTTDTFRSLHQAGTFVMPNPWDRGSARILADMGFAALATTSAGLGRAIGKDDQEVTRDELVAHVADLTAFIDVPLNVDSERLFPDEPGGIARCVELLAEAGAAGLSIEDYNPATSSIDGIEAATAAVAEAARACAASGLVLTARCESHLYGPADLDDTIARLIAYGDAGAEVLYAPGLTAPADIQRVVTEVAWPINVLAMPAAPTVAELARLGVRRISSGSGLYNASVRSLREAADALQLSD